MTPAIGITGVRSILATPHPASISHYEGLLDGRTLRVRAHVASMVVHWGDDWFSEHDPNLAETLPGSAASHVYRQKTCTASYREAHPSGGLCHPTLEAYPIVAAFVWVGQFDLGDGWIRLGTLTTRSAVTYDVDEARGAISR